MLISNPKSHYDVLIVGGGMVGSSFALDLHRRCPTLNIAIVEAVAIDNQAQQPSFDARATALSRGTRTIYEAMGLWEKLQPSVTSIKTIEVSDQGHFGTTRLHHSEQGTDALGYVVENRDLGAVLNEQLLASNSIELLAPAKIESAKPLAGAMSVRLASGQQINDAVTGVASGQQTNDGVTSAGSGQQINDITTELLVVADGGRSPLCKQLGIEHSRESYGQCALITTLAVQMPHKHRAFERFTDAGPLAVLPLQTFENETRCSLVWTVNAGAEQALLDCEDAEFIARLSTLFGSRLGTITRLGKRFSFPLALTEAREQIRPHLVLLGNVAHTLHPVAGQGFNLALRDSARLAASLAKAKHSEHSSATTEPEDYSGSAASASWTGSADSTGWVSSAGSGSSIEPSALTKSIGSMRVLQEYLDQQIPDQQQAAQFTHQLVRLFSSNSTGKVLARKAGLLSLELVPAMRQEFARQAMGIHPNC